MFDDRTDSKFVTIPFEDLVRETDMAWLLLIDGEEVWLPKSQCTIEIHRETMVASSGEVEVPTWLAIEKELV